MSLREDFERDGVAVVRNAVPPEHVAAWLHAYECMPQRTPGWNKVEVNGPFPEPLASMYKHPGLLDIAQAVFGPDLALYNFRLVVKDAQAREAVFLHQDTGYHVGFMRKASLFVALSPVNTRNGAMTFIKETHKLGYLGDAGQIRMDGGVHEYMTPCLKPGDAVLMHSACWHDSSECETGEPARVMADIIIQPADDPSGIELLRGQWRCEPQPWLRSGELFVRSRASRLKELQARVDVLEDDAKGRTR